MWLSERFLRTVSGLSEPLPLRGHPTQEEVGPALSWTLGTQRRRRPGAHVARGPRGGRCGSRRAEMEQRWDGTRDGTDDAGGRVPAGLCDETAFPVSRRRAVLRTEGERPRPPAPGRSPQEEPIPAGWGAL